MSKKDSEKRMEKKKKVILPGGFSVPGNAALAAAMRETYGGGRPRKPTRCVVCGRMWNSARKAQACLHGGGGD
jgi:hypothetical protein